MTFYDSIRAIKYPNTKLLSYSLSAIKEDFEVITDLFLGKNIVFTGKGLMSKLEKAQKLGIEIISMDDFYQMIEGIELDEKQKTKIASFIKNEDEILSNKLSGECITLYPISIAMTNKVSKIVEKHGAKALSRLRQKETTLLVYQPYAEELVTVEKARKLNIKTMTLGKFNRYLIELLYQ